MAKPKSSVIKIRNDPLNDENIFSELAPQQQHHQQQQQQQQHLKANNDKNNNNIIHISNTNNNNNNNNINNSNKQDITYKNANNFNKNCIPMEKILNQPNGINQDALNEQAYFQQANFNDGFVYDDLSMLPLIDDKAILNNLKSKFENQKYYVSFSKEKKNIIYKI